jgi:hypothetical protein
MYCTIPIFVTYKSTYALIVVTEIEYAPEQHMTPHCEPLPESVGILDGYLVCDDTNLTFQEVLDANAGIVVSKALKWYKEI